jgi:hypothetical protein
MNISRYKPLVYLYNRKYRWHDGLHILVETCFDKMSILWNILKQLHVPVVTKLITGIHIRSYLLLKKTE